MVPNLQVQTCSRCSGEVGTPDSLTRVLFSEIGGIFPFKWKGSRKTLQKASLLPGPCPRF